MWWQYLLVFVGAFICDIVPFPFPPAFTVMILLQIKFDLDIWAVIGLGVTGSILGRFLLTLYIPRLSKSIFNPQKNEDVQYLGKKLKQKGWQGQLVVLAYSLLPLPTTPLFVAAGMGRVGPLYIIPAFIIGKFTSDTAALFMGRYAATNAEQVMEGMISWKSIASLVFGGLLRAAVLFIDWRTLIQKKKFSLRFQIWK
jgi:membrane protein YqaA with SNARE-associated domain